MTLIDFTLSNARRFYSSMGNPWDTEGLMTIGDVNDIFHAWIGSFSNDEDNDKENVTWK